MNKKYEILEMHICAFERTETTTLKTDLNMYPKRICVLDKKNNIVIDVLTLHKYEYIKTINMKYCIAGFKKQEIRPGRRVACFENEIVLLNLDSKTIKLCNKIIELLERNILFKDGNDELSNEDYLKMIDCKKNKLKTEKIYKKRK